jgi:hypothetical protein
MPTRMSHVKDGWITYLGDDDGFLPNALALARYVYERVRDLLARRHKVAGCGTHRFSCDVVYGELGLLRLESLPLTVPLCASR